MVSRRCKQLNLHAFVSHRLTFTVRSTDKHIAWRRKLPIDGERFIAVMAETLMTPGSPGCYSANTSYNATNTVERVFAEAAPSRLKKQNLSTPTAAALRR